MFAFSLLSSQLQSGAHFTLIARWRNRSRTCGQDIQPGHASFFPYSFSLCLCFCFTRSPPAARRPPCAVRPRLHLLPSISLGLLLLPFAIILVSECTVAHFSSARHSLTSFVRPVYVCVCVSVTRCASLHPAVSDLPMSWAK